MPNRYTTLAALFVADVALFTLAGLPAFKNAHHGARSVVGGIGWFGGLACTVALVALSLATLVRNVRRRRMAVTTSLVLALVGAAAAVAAAGRPGPAKPSLRLELPGTTSTYVDLGRKGYSPGDYFLSSGRLLDLPARRPVGRLGGVWTILSRAADHASFDLGLRDGTIFVAGRIVHAAPESILEVTGGTGRYSGARGTASFRYLSRSTAGIDVRLR